MNKKISNKIKRLSLKYLHNDLNAEIINLTNNCIYSFSRDSIWIYTLMKSGTTFTLLFLSNYISYLKGEREHVSYDQMQQKFILHSLEDRIKNIDLNDFIRINSKLCKEIAIPPIIHTHIFIESEQWLKNISLYRNPLDFIISSYFYFYINRGARINHPRMIMIPMIENFATVYNHQIALKKEFPGKTIQISYEDLKVSPENEFKKMIRFLEIPLNTNAMSFALDNSSPKKIKEMEKERGEAIVKRDGTKFSGSFIRSGKIGEWKEYFNDDDLKNIENQLNQFGINLNDFVLD